jgi:hypothetical protein
VFVSVCSAPPRIHAEATGSKRDDLEHSASHRDVLQKVNELVLVGEMVVEEERCERSLSR